MFVVLVDRMGTLVIVADDVLKDSQACLLLKFIIQDCPLIISQSKIITAPNIIYIPFLFYSLTERPRFRLFARTDFIEEYSFVRFGYHDFLAIHKYAFEGFMAKLFELSFFLTQDFGVAVI